MVNDMNFWLVSNQELINRMNNWRDSYSCKSNCDEWQKWEFCSHLRKSRAQVFGKEITKQISVLTQTDTNLVALEPSQSLAIA